MTRKLISLTLILALIMSITSISVVYANGDLFAVVISENTFFSRFFALYDSGTFAGGAGAVIDEARIF